jgi:hypothetical protein
MAFQRFVHSISRHFARVFLMCLGVVRLNFTDTPSETARIFVSNSLSLLDYFVIFCSTPFTFLNKSDTNTAERICFSTLFDTFVLTPQGDKKKNVKPRYQLENAASDPSLFPLLIFPEGRQTNGDAVIQFDPDPFANEYEVQGVYLQYTLGFTPRGFNAVFSGDSLFGFVLRLVSIPFVVVNGGYIRADARGKINADVNRKAEGWQLAVANRLKVNALKCTRD